MGLLGAMAGAGQGLIDYSTTLKEKEKMDWLAQQEAVKHERAMNMEKLREAGMEKRQGAQITSSEGIASMQEGGANTRQGLQIGSAERISAAGNASSEKINASSQAGANYRTMLGESGANARQESANKNAEGLLRLRGELDRANVVVGEIGGVPVYADEKSKLSDPGFKKLSDSAIDSKIKEAEKINEAEHKIAADKWAETIKDPAFGQLPASLQALTAVQYSISGDVDISKLLSGQAAGTKGSGKNPDGSDRKTPTAEHLKIVMEQMMLDESLASLPPMAVLSLAGKGATQVANNEELSWGGKVVNPDDYATIARELDKGKRDWAELKILDKESIKGIAEAWEALHPSTPLQVTKVAPQSTSKVLTGATAGELEAAESFGTGAPKGYDMGAKIGKSVSSWQEDKDRRRKEAAAKYQ